MSREYSYYVLIKGDNALLIEREDYEETTAFATGYDDYTKHRLLETITVEDYKTKGEKMPKWNKATLVESSYDFFDYMEGDWSQYDYMTQGVGRTMKRIKKSFG